jgi:hypothetical protein
VAEGDDMITRRKLLTWLGLGGAAAAVAGKVEAAAERVPVEPKLHPYDEYLVSNSAAGPSVYDQKAFFAEPAIDPSTYPRVVVRTQATRSLYAPDLYDGRACEYTAAERIELGEFVALRDDGLAVRWSTRSTVTGLAAALGDAPPLVGVCVEYIEGPRKPGPYAQTVERRAFGTVESAQPDGEAWARVGARPVHKNPTWVSSELGRKLLDLTCTDACCDDAAWSRVLQRGMHDADRAMHERIRKQGEEG